MEDEGRQRTAKFISHKCVSLNALLLVQHLNTVLPTVSCRDRYVGVSDQFQLFAKEQERSKLLSSSAAQGSDTPPVAAAAAETPSTSKSDGYAQTSAQKKKSGTGGDRAAELIRHTRVEPY